MTGKEIVAWVKISIIKITNSNQDKLLIGIFGGFFLGLGIRLAVRGGGVIDSTEVFAINFTKRPGLTVGDIIFSSTILFLL